MRNVCLLYLRAAVCMCVYSSMYMCVCLCVCMFVSIWFSLNARANERRKKNKYVNKKIKCFVRTYSKPLANLINCHFFLFPHGGTSSLAFLDCVKQNAAQILHYYSYLNANKHLAVSCTSNSKSSAFYGALETPGVHFV